MNDKPVQVRFQCCVQTMPFEKMLDMAGFLICPEHHYRRYGWQSARIKKYKVQPFDPERPEYISRPEYGETRLEQDQAIVREIFGE